MREEYEKMEMKLTDEQFVVYDTILKDIQNQNGGLFFVYGYGGTGKTFVWKALSSKIRSSGDIVLNVASSGIASLLLPGGRTAHSRFAILIAVNEDSTCNICQGSHLAELLIQAKLIIWDEAPMMHKHCFKALDKTMRDLLRHSDPNSVHKTFGGKTVVLGGDFRQILPVVPKGSRQDIVSAAINSSYLWDSCKVLRLTKNLRLTTLDDSASKEHIEQFASWLADIGNGILGGPNDGHGKVEIPEEMLLPSNGDYISTIVDSVFPMFRQGGSDLQQMENRAILAPTLDVVNAVNEYMSGLHVAESKTYLSSDTLCKSDSTNGILYDMHTPEFLNGLKASGIPKHSLTLKIGSPVMLLRNIDHSMGLCNGTRLIITRLSDHVVETKIVAGHNAGNVVLIPRMSMTPTDTRLPFKFQRRQFPLMLSYAMTINKSQGQTLTHVGLLLKKPVFVHGQLYVAASRISNPNGLKILIPNEGGESSNYTTNVVYHEVFNNL
ncbi:ATP-dependent DNA helicase PIF1-like [Ipomoea triloba]|uniref:ATP-dependent DNA helicase PIF1-like n=1 Tax=Ipomoea triloba TaxID=35885 RepID=UPI00125E3091|nr:ATP-dependent DNA helicase PIF1-like [Ipomoea triloba]